MKVRDAERICDRCGEPAASGSDITWWRISAPYQDLCEDCFAAMSDMISAWVAVGLTGNARHREGYVEALNQALSLLQTLHDDATKAPVALRGDGGAA